MSWRSCAANTILGEGGGEEGRERGEGEGEESQVG